MKKSLIVTIVILVVSNIIGICAYVRQAAQVDDCIHEIDDFKNYYDAVESVLDNMQAGDYTDYLEPFLDSDDGSKYLDVRKHLSRTWKRNHGTDIDAYVDYKHQRN